MWPSLLKSISLRGPRKSNSELYNDIIEKMIIFVKSKKTGGHLKTMLEIINIYFLKQDVKRLMIDEDAVVIHGTKDDPWYTCDAFREYTNFTVNKYALPKIKNKLKESGEITQLFLRQIQFFTFSGVPSFLGNVKKPFSYIGLCSCGIPKLDELPFTDPLNEAFDYKGHVQAINILIDKAQNLKWQKPKFVFEEKYEKMIPDAQKLQYITSKRDVLSIMVQEISINLSNISILEKLKSECKEFYTDIKNTCYEELGLDWQMIHDLETSTYEELTRKQYKQGQILGQVVLFGGCIRIAYILQCALHIHIEKLTEEEKRKQEPVQQVLARKPESSNELAGQMIPKKKQQESGPKLSVPSTSTSALNIVKVEEVEEVTIPPVKTKKKKGKDKKKEEKIDEDDELLNAAMARAKLEKKEHEDILMKVMQREISTYSPTDELKELQNNNLRYKWEIKNPFENTYHQASDEVIKDQKDIEEFILNNYLKSGGHIFYEPYFSKLLDAFIYSKRLNMYPDEDKIRTRKLKADILPSMMIPPDRSEILLTESSKSVSVKERWSDAFGRWVYQNIKNNKTYFDDAFERDDFSKPDPPNKSHQIVTNKLVKEALRTIISIRNKILKMKYEYFTKLLDNYFSKKDASLIEIGEIFQTTIWLFTNTMYNDDPGSDTSFSGNRIWLIESIIRHIFSGSESNLREGFQKLNENKRVEFTAFLFSISCRDIMALNQIIHFRGTQTPSILYKQLVMSLSLLFNIIQSCEGGGSLCKIDEHIITSDKLPIWLLNDILKMHQDIKRNWPAWQDSDIDKLEMHMMIIYIFVNLCVNFTRKLVPYWTKSNSEHLKEFHNSLKQYWPPNDQHQKLVLKQSITFVEEIIDYKSKN